MLTSTGIAIRAVCNLGVWQSNNLFSHSFEHCGWAFSQSNFQPIHIFLHALTDARQHSLKQVVYCYLSSVYTLHNHSCKNAGRDFDFLLYGFEGYWQCKSWHSIYRNLVLIGYFIKLQKLSSKLMSKDCLCFPLHSLDFM